MVGSFNDHSLEFFCSYHVSCWGCNKKVTQYVALFQAIIFFCSHTFIQLTKPLTSKFPVDDLQTYFHVELIKVNMAEFSYVK